MNGVSQNPLAAIMLLFLLVVMMIGVAIFRYRIVPYLRSLHSTTKPADTRGKGLQ